MSYTYVRMWLQQNPGFIQFAFLFNIHNNSPLHNGLFHIKLFAEVNQRANLKLMYLFGCLAFVLDKCLCNGGKTPKWNPYSCQGLYLGLPPHHASNLSLIDNLTTKHVLPQFHIVYNDEFISVNSTHLPTWPTIFDNLFTFSKKESLEDFDFSHDIVSLSHSPLHNHGGSLSPPEGASFPSE